jgi:hypothetical protein
VWERAVGLEPYPHIAASALGYEPIANYDC